MNKCVCGGKVDTLVLGTSSSECEFESHQTHKGATTDLGSHFDSGEFV